MEHITFCLYRTCSWQTLYQPMCSVFQWARLFAYIEAQFSSGPSQSLRNISALSYSGVQFLFQPHFTLIYADFGVSGKLFVNWRSYKTWLYCGYYKAAGLSFAQYKTWRRVLFENSYFLSFIFPIARVSTVSKPLVLTCVFKIENLLFFTLLSLEHMAH